MLIEVQYYMFSLSVLVQYKADLIIISLQIVLEMIYSQTCIKMSPLGQRKSGLNRTGDLLKEAQFLWNVPLQDKKHETFKHRWLLNRGDCMDRFDCSLKIDELALNTNHSLTLSLWYLQTFLFFYFQAQYFTRVFY
jgi:hypothetical protein